MSESETTAAVSAAWAVDLRLGAEMTLPSGESLDREAFFEWLWEQHGEHGLVGVSEGAIATGEAYALGLTPDPRVLDAAAAPPDRDWIGSLPELQVTCWFLTEPAARVAAEHCAGVRGCRVRDIRRESWHEHDDWKQAFVPIDVPGFGVIRPAWEPGAAGTTALGTTVFIDPGAGFGTGLHETTRLCLAALGGWAREGGPVTRVLDFGSGSGILGSAAAVGGARRVDSVEIDARVHDAIRQNAHRNGVADRVSVRRELPAGGLPYDLVFANIVASVLLDHAEHLCSLVRRGGGGRLVLSGLLAEEVPVVADRYAHALGAPATQAAMREWHCVGFVAE